jgi:flagellar FliL protein
MANKDDLNLGKDKDAAATEEKSGGKGKLIIIIVAVLVLLGGGAAAFFMLSGGDEDEAGGAEAVEEVVEAPKEPLYLQMEKVLVNIEHQGRTRYVQAEMQLMSYDQAVIDQATRDMPALRNRMIMLFSAQDFEALKTLEGKEALRAEVKAALNAELGLSAPAAVEEVYFEAFVLQ